MTKIIVLVCSTTKVTEGAESIRLGGFRMPKSRVSSKGFSGRGSGTARTRDSRPFLAFTILSDSFLSAIQLVSNG